MRLAITLHKIGGAWKVVTGPDIPIDTQKQAFKDLVVGENKDKVEEAQVWESGRGVTKHKRFDLPKTKSKSSNMPDPKPYPKPEPKPEPEPTKPDRTHENEPRPATPTPEPDQPDRGPQHKPVKDHPATKGTGRKY